MIKFTLNRNRNGKKSRWAKKYPRKRILKGGGEKAAGWYFHNWYDDGYHYFHGDLHKFLLKNVGRPVDKVFSEFLQRCRRGTDEKQLLGTFYISDGLYESRKATVYVAAKSDYKASYFYMRIAKIKEIGIGVRFWVSKSQDGKYLIYITYSEYKWSNRKLPDYVFLTKEEKISD